MKKLNLNLAFALLVTVGGCSQVLGIGDYDIDPSLDNAKAGTAGSGNDAGGEGGVSNGGKSGNGGKAGSDAVGGAAGSDASPGGEGPGGGAGGQPPSTTGGGGQGGEPPLSDTGGAGGEGGGARELIPCDSADCCTQAGGVAEGVELLLSSTIDGNPYYGDFELGTLADGSPWYESSEKFTNLIADKDTSNGTALPHKGDYFAWLGSEAQEESFMESEAFVLPEDAGWLALNGFRKFQPDSDVSDPMNNDVAMISLSNESETVDSFLYWDSTDPGETSGWQKFDATIDAAPSQGKTLYLDLYALDDDYSTDATITGSNYMFDDISLKVFRCYTK